MGIACILIFSNISPSPVSSPCGFKIPSNLVPLLLMLLPCGTNRRSSEAEVKITSTKKQIGQVLSKAHLVANILNSQNCDQP